MKAFFAQGKSRTVKAKALARGTLILTLLGSLAVGCGAAQPTKELVDARRAYDKARQSRAPELVPDQLLTAQQALEQAEVAHEDDSGSIQEKTLAYIAQRKAAMALAGANMAEARQNIAQADEQYKALQETLRRSAESDAARNQAELERVREQLASKTDKLGEQAQALQRKETELIARQKELEQEKAARIDAEKKAAAALASLEEIAKVKEESRGLVITLDGSVLFTTGQSQLLPIAQQKLEQVAQALQEQDDSKKIVVEGHTDSVGSEENNRRLSQQRAESVRTFLVSQGVPSHRISAVGKGESEPIGDNRTPEGRANNRRVEIVVSGGNSS